MTHLGTADTMNMEKLALAQRNFARKRVEEVRVGDYLIVYGAVSKITSHPLDLGVVFGFEGSNLTARFLKDETVTVISAEDV